MSLSTVRHDSTDARAGDHWIGLDDAVRTNVGADARTGADVNEVVVLNLVSDRQRVWNRLA